MRGEKFCRARLIQPPAVTPLQQLLFDHIWVQGRRELYQPIDSPELREEWDIVRRCDDRFDLMQGFLHDQRLMPPDAATYLDVACSYGWFVNAFHRSGFIARGVELDWSACEIAKYCFGLNSEQITRSEVVRYLTHDSQTYDLVSCFSLLHHFVMKRGSISAEALLALLDAKAMKVLFLDMGQEHEEWFHETLAGWNPDRIEQWIIANSTFKKVFRLGTDHDNVPPYEKNYGRTLFACMR
jgi:hypothetical protein